MSNNDSYDGEDELTEEEDDDPHYPAKPLTTGKEPGFRVGTWRGDRMITAGNTWSHPANADVLRQYWVHSTQKRMLPYFENSHLTDHGREQLEVLQELCEERDRDYTAAGYSAKAALAKHGGEINKTKIFPKLLERGMTRETEKRKEKRARARGEPYKPLTRVQMEAIRRMRPTLDDKGDISRVNELRFVPLNQLRWPGGGVTQAMWDQFTAKDRNAPTGQKVRYIDVGPNGPLAKGEDLTAGYLKRRTKRGEKSIAPVIEISSDDSGDEDDVEADQSE